MKCFSSILSKATQEKAEKLRRNNAAKKIQRGWKDYVDRKEQSEVFVEIVHNFKLILGQFFKLLLNLLLLN